MQQASSSESPESLPILQLEPARSMVRPGESVVVDCSSSAGTDVPIRWEKSDGTPLPYNIRQEGNRLYIQNAREDDTGSYTCICYTDDGLRYITDFQLEVEENTIPDVLPRSTSRLEFAERGTTVKLQCNTDQYPTSYQWTRENGELPSDRDTRGSTLILPNVQASDAGKYVCSAKHGGQLVNVVTTLVVNNVIPFFPQSPLSYMEFKSFDNVYSKFYFEISFKPEKMNGLILYASQRRPNQDYIALSLRNGYPQFRFNFDGQQVVLQPEKPVHMGKWHTVKVNRVRNNGFLLVDDQTPVNFPEKLKFYGLNLDDHLFVGGVPQFDQVPASAMEFKEGFVGCISRLKLNDREVQLYQDALETVGITTCEPCAEDPCNNAGTCMEAQTAQGFSCLCRDGFTGRNCQHEGDGCSMDTCGVGRCEETDSGTECYCPIHKTGDRCQYTEHYTDATLAFKDGSYAAYDKFQSKRSIRFRFKPDSLENGIMFYAAEHEQSYGDFMAAILNNGFVELRYSVAGVPIEVGQWHTVSAGRSKAGIGYLQVDDEPVHNEVSNRNTPILLKTKVYAGGYDKRLLLSQEIGVRRGFEGCIAELETSSNKLNMIDDIRDSANVYHCGHAGAPQPYPSGDQNPVTCRPGRGGDDCETITDICLEQRPCENGALCQTHQGGQNYTCTCQPGYLGLRCEVQYNTLVASRFAGNGFIEINPKAFKNNENQVTTEIAIMFSTQEQNGLLIWYGQRNDEEFLGHDYIALAIQSGFAELTIRMDGQESYVRNSDVYVSDQERHVALIRRERNQFHLQVDSLTVHGETRPTGKQTMDIPGSIYVGGVPDIERVTGNRFNESFNGCVFSVENIEENQSIELRDYAIRTVNVDVCDDPSWIPSSLLYTDFDDLDDTLGPYEFDKIEEPPPVHIIYPRPYNGARYGAPSTCWISILAIQLMMLLLTHNLTPSHDSVVQQHSENFDSYRQLLVMEPPYSYLQVDIQEHPTPIEFPPPFSIEEFNLYHHHGYPPHMNYDKNALYMNHLSLSGSMFPNGASRSTHKSKGHNTKHQQQQQQQQHQHQSQHQQQHHHQQHQHPQHQQPHQQQQQQQQPHPPQQPQQPSPAPAHPPPVHNSRMTKEEKPETFNKESPQAPPTPATSSEPSFKLKQSPTVPEDSIKNLSVKQLIRAKHTLQQRIKRQNETPEQKAARRLRNAELNRRRRQNKEDIRVTIEKTKNRLRQRIKREIDRMLRTRQKRDDFLRETFEQMATVFADEDMLQYQERVANVLWEISKAGGADTASHGSENSGTSTTERSVS
uniref:Basement membrane-specific heparan sulfate proteoglycan core protein n=1 Tax=Anopheles funestus TaxID=62324 RepID=A0A182RB94_ANOFN